MLLCAIFNLIFNLAKYCDQLVCLSVWLLAYIKKNTSPNITNFSVHVSCDRGSVLL